MSTSRIVPHVGTLLQESFDQLVVGASVGSYRKFDSLVNFLTLQHRSHPTYQINGDSIDMGRLADGFRELGFSVPTESDIGHYKSELQSSEASGANHHIARVLNEHIEDYSNRVVAVLRVLNKFEGGLAADQGLARVVCGLLAHHVRHGDPDPMKFKDDASFIVSCAQRLQRSLNADLSNAFKECEVMWSDHTAQHLQLSQERWSEYLSYTDGLFVKGEDSSAHSIMDDYVEHVAEVVASYQPAGVHSRLAIPLTGANALKYAYLLGVVNPDRVHSIVDTDWNPGVCDVQVLTKGALALARVSIEYQAIQDLAGNVSRSTEFFDVNKSDLHSSRSVLFADDLWKIAAPLCVARVMRRDPCQPVYLGATEGSTAAPYLSGMKYLQSFVERSSASNIGLPAFA